MPIATVNPATGETLRTFTAHDEDEVEAKLVLGEHAFAAARRESIGGRAGKMLRLADLLEADRESFARLATLEMGKPLSAARSEIEKCAWACRYYAEHAGRFLADELVDTGPARTFVRYQPLGIILAVMPWNFPFWQVFRFAAPTVMAGNVGILKHASSVPQCALAIEDVFLRAGFAAGTMQALLVEPERVAGLLDDPRIRAATLTGSTRAGSSVGERAGLRIKKTVLELGGSDPFIVLPSADLAAAARTGAQSRTLNNGQSCIAAKRFIVHREVADTFERHLIREMSALRVGDPLDETTDVGPLATAAMRDEVHEQVARSVAMGAQLLLGGAPVHGAGFYYPPTILADIPPAAPAYSEEVFGPVALLFRVADAEAAARLANDTRFGLGSSVWSQDTAEVEWFVNEIDAGMVFVNAMVASDPRLPFGGVKASGYGRELGAAGIREFVNAKTVWIEPSGPSPESNRHRADSE